MYEKSDFFAPESEPQDDLSVAISRMKEEMGRAEVTQQSRPILESMDTSAPFSEYELNLADTDMSPLYSPGTINSTGRKISMSGFGLYYRKEGSAPGGRLDIKFGSILRNFKPGDYIEGSFKEFQVVRSLRSSINGFANLVVIRRQGVKFTEPVTMDDARFEPVDLLGSFAAGTFVNQAENARPPTHSLSYDNASGNFTMGETITGGTSGATGILANQVDNGATGTLYFATVSGTFTNNEVLTGGTSATTADADGGSAVLTAFTNTSIFPVSGWRRIRFYLDGQSSNTLTSVTLRPWFNTVTFSSTGTIVANSGNLNLWFENGLGLISVPDSSLTAYRYRTFYMDLTENMLPNMYCFLEIRSLLPSAATQLGIIAQGVR